MTVWFRLRIEESSMLPRAASSIILLIGGCSGGEEAGALRSIEEVAFQRSEAGLEGHTRIVGQLQEQRRSPAVFREKDDVLVIGGLCQSVYEIVRTDNFF
ncbi:hypothetical protein Y032_0111g244 [Ancylostoma ceylanicum]|uniref:Kelch repeat protein n=2 Tax=Ancylostoma ceylanicum TaxID=53326 RepID=A0A016TEC8_9BILA|nr:hypothetical protein Y032_0111g244 [Ancylostoma ceylanicum]